LFQLRQRALVTGARADERGVARGVVVLFLQRSVGPHQSRAGARRILVGVIDGHRAVGRALHQRRRLIRAVEGEHAAPGAYHQHQ